MRMGCEFPAGESNSAKNRVAKDIKDINLWLFGIELALIFLYMYASEGLLEVNFLTYRQMHQ